jgi:hypothetical protein
MGVKVENMSNTIVRKEKITSSFLSSFSLIALMLAALPATSNAEPTIKIEFASGGGRNDVANVIGGGHGLRTNDAGEFILYNEKPYAISVFLVTKDDSGKQTRREIVLPPRGDGPIKTAAQAVLSNPISGISEIVSGQAGKSEVNLGKINPSSIVGAFYTAGTEKSQRVNISYALASMVQTTASLLFESSDEKTLTGSVIKKAINNLTSAESVSTIISEIENGCGILTTCRTMMSDMVAESLRQAFEDELYRASLLTTLIASGMSTAKANSILDGLSEKSFSIKAINILSAAEAYGDIGAIISSSIRFSDGPTNLGVSTITISEPPQLLTGPGATLPQLQWGQVLPSVPAFSGTPNQPFELVSYYAEAPDVTDDLQADIIEDAQPVDPPPTATWAGRMSLSGRYTIGLNPATGVVEAMEASGDAPVNNFILFNPDAGSISQPLQGVQTTAGIGHSFNHLIWGNWSGGARVWEDNSDQAVGELSGFFVYGELTPATSRTNGSATYTGRLRGDVIEEGGAIHRGLAYGDFGLTANFGTGALGGWLAIAGEDSTDYVFVTDITDARIVRQSDRLAFYGDLGSNYDDASGSIEGYFYGANATELGGTYEVTNTNGEGSSHGILLGWETGTMPDRPADPEDSLAIIVGYDSSANGHGTAWNEGNATGSVISYNDTSDTVESVTKTDTFAADGYSYVSWGSWAANDTTRDELGPNGTWVDVTSVTPSSVIAGRTGTAEYSGHIVGGYVSNGGVRDDARGLINITADFTDQSVSGEFQFGHGCGGSGSGPSGCSAVSSVATFEEPISDYGGSGFGNHVGGAPSGVVGVFGGPNGEEIGGNAWLTEDNGMYIGVFRAGQ